MKRLTCFCLTVQCTITAVAQLPYTNAVYSIRKDSAVVYGVAVNYCGRPDTLKMNIYKPTGDNNRERPVILFVHGGAFTSGENFNEYHMNALAMEFARRGYVAASIDYREGHHLFPYAMGTPAPIGLGIFADWTETARLYVTDSAEVIRSLYRAQQDTKAAVRFMKQNHLADSSSPCRVFLGGHSAGGITVTAAAFMDLPVEKSPLAGVTSTAANPNWMSWGFNWFGNWVITQVNGPQDRDDAGYRLHNPAPFNYDAPACYTRPDLGSIDGTINTTSGYNASVLGVASLAGAVLDTNIFNGPMRPAFFLYHIPNDIVVPYFSGYPFTFLQDLLSPPPHYKWPVFYGSAWMKEKLGRLNYSSSYKLQTFDNGGSITNTHDILPNDAVVADSIARFFAKVIAANNGCNTVLANSPDYTLQEKDKRPLLQWDATGSTSGDTCFIERSINGQNFMTVGSVVCKAAPDSKMQFIDESAPGGNTWYYRLKFAASVTSSIVYSTVKQIRLHNEPGFNFYPNPVAGVLNVGLPAEKVNGQMAISVFDMGGATVYHKNFRTQQLQQFNLSLLVNGSYRVSLTDNSGQVFTTSITVLH